MKISGSNVVPFPVEQVWDAILDPRVLVATIPGCERLETTGDHQYSMTVTAGVAAIKGTYAGSCALSDLAENQSLVMRLQGAGAPGTIDATVDVAFNDLGAEGTRIDYEADAVVGGMVGGVGQRMLTSVSKRMAGEFFGNVGNAIGAPAASASAAPAGTAEPAPASAGQVFAAPAKSSAIGSQDDFVKGIVVGAGLVLLGVVAGSVFGRRR
jgi:carbon monoxide dehydrogenase subunit G